jgi:hypothetical protein
MWMNTLIMPATPNLRVGPPTQFRRTASISTSIFTCTIYGVQKRSRQVEHYKAYYKCIIKLPTDGCTAVPHDGEDRKGEALWPSIL